MNPRKLCFFYTGDVSLYFWNHTLSNVCIHKHTYISVSSLPWNLNYLKEKLQWMHSNRTSHLLFTSTFQSFKSGSFLIFPELLDSNRLRIKTPKEKVMYTQGKKQNPLCQVHLCSLKDMQNPFQTGRGTDPCLRPFLIQLPSVSIQSVLFSS